jgi:quercetin dioxygenase-like cupin family protein
MIDTSAASRVYGAGEGDTARLFADEIAVKEQRPELDIFEAVLHAGSEPPLHIHRREHEWIYLVEGAITVFNRGEERPVTQGSLVFLPRGIAHTYAVDSDTARVLTVHSPGGFARMFQDLAAALGDDMPSAPGAEIGELMGPVCDAYGVVMVAPNPRHA